MMGNKELFWSQYSGIGLNLELIWSTPSSFTFLRRHQCSSRLVRNFSGTLCSSVKQIKAPSLFDWEQGIALHAMQGNRASSLSEREVSWFFSTCGGNLGYVLELRRGYTLNTFVCSATSGLLSSYDGHHRNLNYTWQDNADASEGESGDRVSLSSWKSDIGIPIHFQRVSNIVTV